MAILTNHVCLSINIYYYVCKSDIVRSENKVNVDRCLLETITNMYKDVDILYSYIEFPQEEEAIKKQIQDIRDAGLKEFEDRVKYLFGYVEYISTYNYLKDYFDMKDSMILDRNMEEFKVDYVLIYIYFRTNALLV